MKLFRRIFLPTCLFGPILLLGSPEAVQNSRDLVRQWIALEKTLSKEALEWETESRLLKDLTEVAQQKVERLQAELEVSKSAASAADEKRADLAERAEKIDTQFQLIEARIAPMEAHFRDLKRRLPPPLETELRSLFQSLPADPSQSTASLGERMQTLVALANKIREFDGRISVSEEIRERTDGSGKAAFRTLWIGLGQAYYLGPDDAGFGFPDSQGWQWHSKPDFGSRIRSALDLAEGIGEPALIELPVQLKGNASK